MIQSYLLVAYRSLLRNKVFSLINISGLSIGMAVVFMIYQYIQSERSYDTFNARAENIFRVPIKYEGDLAGDPMAVNHPAIAPAMKADFPEVKRFARLVRSSMFLGANTFTYENGTNQPLTFNEQRVYLADEDILSMFSFPFIEGDELALKEAMSIVLSKAVAARYFGTTSAIGKTLLLNRMPCKVAAVVDVPENSHLQFDVLISFNTLGADWGNNEWAWPEFYNYVELHQGTDTRALEAKFPAFMEKYCGKIWKQYKFHSVIWLQPILDIHLKSNLALEQSPTGSERNVTFLTLLGVFILGMAWINYINLSTAKALERSKEVGLRKVSGASRLQLVIQFFFDAMLVNIIATVLAALMTFVATPYFESLTGKHISQVLISSGAFYTPTFWSWVIGMLIVGIIIVGLYPAMVLSSFNPALVLKGKFTKTTRGIMLRKGMVMFQYVLSILLVAGTITMSTQRQFMDKQDLGYSRDQMLVVRGTAIGDSTYSTHMNHFTNAVKSLTWVKNIANSSEVPGQTISSRNLMHQVGKGEEDNVDAFFLEMDENFLETYELSMVAGRNIKDNERFVFVGRDDPQTNGKVITDDGYLTSGAPNRILINEALAKNLGYNSPEDAVNQKVSFELGRKFVGEITGVVKNHNQLSLKEKYQPIAYFIPRYDGWAYHSIHINPNSVGATKAIEDIEKLYTADFPSSAFEFFFLDDHFNKQYQTDVQFARVFGTFTILAIIISLLGLFGLGLYNVSQRIREIGIRRVLGSSMAGILVLFCKESFWLVFIASVVSLPVIYVGAGNWLDNFAFHIDLPWQIFALPPALLLLVSLLVIIAVTLKTGFVSPAKSLKAD